LKRSQYKLEARASESEWLPMFTRSCFGLVIAQLQNSCVGFWCYGQDQKQKRQPHPSDCLWDFTSNL